MFFLIISFESGQTRHIKRGYQDTGYCGIHICQWHISMLNYIYSSWVLETYTLWWLLGVFWQIVSKVESLHNPSSLVQVVKMKIKNRNVWVWKRGIVPPFGNIQWCMMVFLEKDLKLKCMIISFWKCLLLYSKINMASHQLTGICTSEEVSHHNTPWQKDMLLV